jgi:alpha-tubulin suppressor-like RCC1 family protein
VPCFFHIPCELGGAGIDSEKAPDGQVNDVAMTLGQVNDVAMTSSGDGMNGVAYLFLSIQTKFLSLFSTTFLILCHEEKWNIFLHKNKTHRQMGIGFFIEEHQEDKLPEGVFSTEDLPGQDVEDGPAPPGPALREYWWAGNGKGMVAAAPNHSLILNPDRSVSIFGSNLGLGERQAWSRPQILPGITDALCVAAGRDFSAIVRANGHVLTFGAGNNGQLGHPLGDLTPDPVIGIENAIGVACGGTFAMVVKADGTADSIGKVFPGPGGLDTTRQPVLDLPPIFAVACGSTHSIFLCQDGSVMALGSNLFGELGQGNRGNFIRQPVRVGGGELRDVVSISAGEGFSAVVTADGRVATWGAGIDGQLGHGTQNGEPAPRFINGIGDAVAVSCGKWYTAIVHEDGGVSTCGKGRLNAATFGWLGYDNRPFLQLFPRRIDGVADAVAVSCGASHTIIRHRNGRVSTCGSDWEGKGMLGQGPVRASPRPALV